MATGADSFLNCMEARHVQPGMLLSGYADMFKSEWLVESTCSVVATRAIELTMRLGTRVVVKSIDPDDTVLRKVHRTALVPHSKEPSGNGVQEPRKGVL